MGASSHTDAAEAVREITTGWPERSPDLLVVFTSTQQDAAGVRGALEARYPETTLVGCTTSGEHAAGSSRRGSATAAALYTPRVRWTSEVITPLSDFEPEAARCAVREALERLEVDPDLVDPSEVVGVLLCDGLSRKEEVVAAAVADALDGIPLIGGSAGDDLAFQQTLVSERGRTLTDAAVLLVGRGPKDFYRLLKHQHFTVRPAAMAVTRADPAQRRVYELDGFPAADTYARALGIDRAQLAEEAFLNPVVITVQGKPYVRSVQTVHDDGSLTFYCAVEEGWVLDLAGHRPMDGALAQQLANTNGEDRAGFMLGFNCILRALEAQKRGLEESLESTMKAVAEHSVGFDTYGEVLDGLHINQTLVALLLSRAA